jgi:hypothetical protein
VRQASAIVKDALARRPDADHRPASLVVLAGDVPAGGVTVATHHADGTIVSMGVTAADGTYPLGDAPGLLVSAVTFYPDGGKIHTTVVPEAGPVVIHGPPGPLPPTDAVVQLTIAPTGPVPTNPYRYHVSFGCTACWPPLPAITSFPTTVDVPVLELGADPANLDVFIIGHVQTPGGETDSVFTAGRVDVVGGVATFTPATTNDAVPRCWSPSLASGSPTRTLLT